jgi:hypothetical protein
LIGHAGTVGTLLSGAKTLGEAFVGVVVLGR